MQFLITAPTFAQENSTQDVWERWFEEDFEEKAQQVNEGQLKFLPRPPAKKDSHSLTNHIIITPQSLKDQWVSFRQCHKNLDPVAQSQIVYRYKNMRSLRIDSFTGIEKAWVENATIQMEGLKRGAAICISADAQIFRPIKIDGKDAYAIRNGPYYRKFFDGYYPFNLTFSIKYPASEIRLLKMSPESQPGVTVSTKEDLIVVNTWFEGELTIGILFQPLAN